MQKWQTWCILGVALTLLAGAPSGRSQSQTAPTTDDSNPPSQECIDPDYITQIDVRDSRTIDFRLRGPEVYRNVLPRRCMHLRPGQEFSYQTRRFLLCAGNKISFSSDMSMRERPIECELGRFSSLREPEAGNELAQ